MRELTTQDQISVMMTMEPNGQRQQSQSSPCRSRQQVQSSSPRRRRGAPKRHKIKTRIEKKERKPRHVAVPLSSTDYKQARQAESAAKQLVNELKSKGYDPKTGGELLLLSSDEKSQDDDRNDKYLMTRSQEEHLAALEAYRDNESTTMSETTRDSNYYRPHPSDPTGGGSYTTYSGTMMTDDDELGTFTGGGGGSYSYSRSFRSGASQTKSSRSNPTTSNSNSWSASFEDSRQVMRNPHARRQQQQQQRRSDISLNKRQQWSDVEAKALGISLEEEEDGTTADGMSLQTDFAQQDHCHRNHGPTRMIVPPKPTYNPSAMSKNGSSKRGWSGGTRQGDPPPPPTSRQHQQQQQQQQQQRNNIRPPSTASLVGSDITDGESHDNVARPYTENEATVPGNNNNNNKPAADLSKVTGSVQDNTVQQSREGSEAAKTSFGAYPHLQALEPVKESSGHSRMNNESGHSRQSSVKSPSSAATRPFANTTVGYRIGNSNPRSPFRTQDMAGRVFFGEKGQLMAVRSPVSRNHAAASPRGLPPVAESSVEPLSKDDDIESLPLFDTDEDENNDSRHIPKFDGKMALQPMVERSEIYKEHIATTNKQEQQQRDYTMPTCSHTGKELIFIEPVEVTLSDDRALMSKIHPHDSILTEKVPLGTHSSQPLNESNKPFATEHKRKKGFFGRLFRRNNKYDDTSGKAKMVLAVSSSKAGLVSKEELMNQGWRPKDHHLSVGAATDMSLFGRLVATEPRTEADDMDGMGERTMQMNETGYERQLSSPRLEYPLNEEKGGLVDVPGSIVASIDEMNSRKTNSKSDSRSRSVEHSESASFEKNSIKNLSMSRSSSIMRARSFLGSRYEGARSVEAQSVASSVKSGQRSNLFSQFKQPTPKVEVETVVSNEDEEKIDVASHDHVELCTKDGSVVVSNKSNGSTTKNNTSDNMKSTSQATKTMSTIQGDMTERATNISGDQESSKHLQQHDASMPESKLVEIGQSDELSKRQTGGQIPSCDSDDIAVPAISVQELKAMLRDGVGVETVNDRVHGTAALSPSNARLSPDDILAMRAEPQSTDNTEDRSLNPIGDEENSPFLANSNPKNEAMADKDATKIGKNDNGRQSLLSISQSDGRSTPSVQATTNDHDSGHPRIEILKEESFDRSEQELADLVAGIESKSAAIPDSTNVVSAEKSPSESAPIQSCIQLGYVLDDLSVVGPREATDRKVRFSDNLETVEVPSQQRATSEFRATTPNHSRVGKVFATQNGKKTKKTRQQPQGSEKKPTIPSMVPWAQRSIGRENRNRQRQARRKRILEKRRASSKSPKVAASKSRPSSTIISPKSKSKLVLPFSGDVSSLYPSESEFREVTDDQHFLPFPNEKPQQQHQQKLPLPPVLSAAPELHDQPPLSPTSREDGIELIAQPTKKGNDVILIAKTENQQRGGSPSEKIALFDSASSSTVEEQKKQKELHGASSVSGHRGPTLTTQQDVYNDQHKKQDGRRSGGIRFRFFRKKTGSKKIGRGGTITTPSFIPGRRSRRSHTSYRNQDRSSSPATQPTAAESLASSTVPRRPPLPQHLPSKPQEYTVMGSSATPTSLPSSSAVAMAAFSRVSPFAFSDQGTAYTGMTTTALADSTTVGDTTATSATSVSTAVVDGVGIKSKAETTNMTLEDDWFSWLLPGVFAPIPVPKDLSSLSSSNKRGQNNETATTISNIVTADVTTTDSKTMTKMDHKRQQQTTAVIGNQEWQEILDATETMAINYKQKKRQKRTQQQQQPQQQHQGKQPLSLATPPIANNNSNNCDDEVSVSGGSGNSNTVVSHDVSESSTLLEDVQDAIAKFRLHASRLGVTERDLMEAVRDDDRSVVPTPSVAARMSSPPPKNHGGIAVDGAGLGAATDRFLEMFEYYFSEQGLPTAQRTKKTTTKPATATRGGGQEVSGGVVGQVQNQAATV